MEGSGSTAIGGSTDGSSGFGELVDDWVTFGAVQNAGQVAGEYDSGKASRGAAILAGALAISAVLAAGATEGRDAVAADVARPLANATKEELLSHLNPELLRRLFGVGREGAEASLANLPKVEGVTKELLWAYKEIALQQIEKGYDSSGVHAARIKIIDQLLGKM